MKRSEFMEKHKDDIMFVLWENDWRADVLFKLGCRVASIFETKEEEDVVIFNNDTGNQFHKVGMIILKP